MRCRTPVHPNIVVTLLTCTSGHRYGTLLKCTSGHRDVRPYNGTSRHRYVTLCERVGLILVTMLCDAVHFAGPWPGPRQLGNAERMLVEAGWGWGRMKKVLGK